jgi:hypothetical protein
MCDASTRAADIYQENKDLIDWDCDHGTTWNQRIARTVRHLAT